VNTKWKTIFLVDDNASNLIAGRNALSDVYNVYTCNSGARMFKLLEKITPDLILLDVEMPEMDGYEAITQLKGSQRTADIPTIFLTAHGDDQTKARGHVLGAADCITKPFSPPLLLARIEAQLGKTGEKRAECEN